MMKTFQSGFSAVELLITLFIGFLFITMGYQLYSVALQGSGAARETATAGSLAYAKLRDYQFGIGGTCPPGVLPTQDVDNSKAVMTTTISCPIAGLSTLRKVVVKVKYNVTQREVYHAMYIKQ
jgi:hypothetical protein